MEKKKGFFQDAKGNMSSGRLFAFLMLLFFFVSNIMILANLLQDSFVLELNSMLFLLVYDSIILTAIYMPKQLAKMTEVRVMIETLKGKNDD